MGITYGNVNHPAIGVALFQEMEVSIDGDLLIDGWFMIHGKS